MQGFNGKLKELSLKLFEVGALKFGDFKMKVGINSPVYFDLRVIVSYPELLEMLSSLLWQFAQHLNLEPAVLCGVPYTALPIATCICIKSNIPMLIRRKEPKNYGTKKLIEGKFQAGDECLIIEDVVTTGCSILETVNDLKRDGLQVNDTVVVLDREQGGSTNLQNNGIRMHSLLTLSKVLKYLLEEGKIDNETIEKVETYISSTQLLPDGSSMSKDPRENRLTMSYESRSSVTECALARKLFNLMEKKKSNLCVAVDVDNSRQLLEIANSVGEHTCIIKTHYDAVLDWNAESENSLKEVAKKLDFIIMEDRKYGDIGKTVSLQCSQVFRWAELVTVHTIAGSGSLAAAREAAAKFTDRAVFLVAELSTKDNLISPHYTKMTGDLAVSNADLVAGVVCQNPNTVSLPGLIQLTPGVSHTQVDDGLDQTYVSPEDAVLVKGGDIIVVGRAITQSSDPRATASSIKLKLWQAYLDRTAHH